MGCGCSSLEKDILKRFSESDVVLLDQDGFDCFLYDPVMHSVYGDVAILTDDVFWSKSQCSKAFEMPLKEIISMNVYKRQHSQAIPIFQYVLELHYTHKYPKARMDMIFFDEKQAKVWAEEIQKRIPGKGTELDSVINRWEKMEVRVPLVQE